MSMMFTETEIAEHRSDALSRMQSTVTVRRKTGRKVTNLETGRQEPEWTTVHTGLPFRLRGTRAGGGTRATTNGEVESTIGTPEGHFPHDTRDLRDHDLLEVDTGEWSGSVWDIEDASPGGDQQTARRLPITSTPRPAEWGPPAVEPEL